MVVGFPAMALVVDLAGHGWLLVVPSLPKSQSTLVAGVPSSSKVAPPVPPTHTPEVQKEGLVADGGSDGL